MMFSRKLDQLLETECLMKRIRAMGASLVLGLLLNSVVFADGEAEYDYRHGVMEAIGGHMTAMVTILRKGVHQDELALHASGIAALADISPDIFPGGSDVEKSEALPAVWENPAEFNAAMTKFVETAKLMEQAALTGDMAQIGPAIQGLGGACKGCHDDFREEH